MKRFQRPSLGIVVAGLAGLAILAACSPSPASDAQAQQNKPGLAGPMTDYHGKPATEATRAAQQSVEAALPVGDFLDGSLMTDHSNDRLVAKLPPKMGTLEFEKFAFAAGERPDRINPSLFQIFQDTYEGTGLWQVGDGIYQIRGDLAYITFVRGEMGWVILDPGTTAVFSGEAWAFAQQHLPDGADVPVTAVVYSHSHVDHFGGVRGFITQDDVDAGRTQIIAPHGFMEEALSENVIAGNAMLRRAQYHFGSSLDIVPDGSGFASLGLTLQGSLGEFTLIAPTTFLPEGRGEVTAMEVDGVTIHFKDVSSAEAPAATILYLPGHKTIFNSELMYRGQHNIYTLRGARVRDALGWSKLISAVIEEWGDDVETMIGPHGPSFSGNEKIVEYMKTQRDNYGFIHNQTLRLINNGMKIQDVGQAIEDMVPESLSKVWHTHGYHGTYSHNARGGVNRYIGFYDGNPANLNPLPIAPEATKYVEYMGGADEIMRRAQADFDDGNYRFVATVLNKLVTAQPDNWQARHLLADAHEQMGYQAEGPQWRNAYLTAAKELRTGKIKQPPERSTNRDLLAASTVESLLDSIAVRINAPRAEGMAFTLTLNISDTGETYFVELSNSNLSAIAVDGSKPADTTLTIRKLDFLGVMTGAAPLRGLIKEGEASLEGAPDTLLKLASLIDAGDPYYDMVPMPSE